jgi:hypothetical protein
MTLHLTLSIGAATDGARSLEQLNLTATFENRGRKTLSVVIDATPLSHGTYDLDFTDPKGKPVRADSFGMCGTMSPLQESEIADVAPGGSFTTPVHSAGVRLKPGTYKVRVRYRAHRSDHAADSLSPVVVKRLSHFWTGTLQSDWVSLTLHP